MRPLGDLGALLSGGELLESARFTVLADCFRQIQMNRLRFRKEQIALKMYRYMLADGPL